MGSYTRQQRHCPDSSPAADSHYAAHGFTRAPLVVQWMATLRCPLDCPHCLAAAPDGPMADMPLQQVESLIAQTARAGVPEFLVTGGEPLVREDLPDVIGLLEKHALPWSLNTAAMPNTPQQLAMMAYPPTFVAVSLDGPAPVHDGFRGRKGSFDECLAAMRFFASLPQCNVTAGTTVSTVNLAALPETFDIVSHSAANAWGIHLLIPEGRASRRKDLFLSRQEMKNLLHFVARKRRHFPVGLADEFGYAGDLEPLLRDAPLQCGAGRAQVVVLPDGSVVPCTTLDTTTAAGNLSDRPLMAIWQEGFKELRQRAPKGRCQSCEFARACQGGCWLQRRGGVNCYKETWQVPGMLKTAAGVVLCLGLAGATEASPPDLAQKGRPGAAALVSDAPAEMGGALEGAVLNRSVAELSFHWQFRKERLDEGKKAAGFVPAGPLKDDAGALFLTQFYAGTLPQSLSQRVEAVSNGLATPTRSLGLVAVMWRAVLEPTLDGPLPHKRPGKDREALAKGILMMGTVAQKWRQEIVAKQLVPYLQRGRTTIRHRFELSKAYRPAPPWVQMARDTQKERWGASASGLAEPIGEEFLKRHPYAEEMRLSVLLPKAREARRFHPGGEDVEVGGFDVGVFDVVRSPAGESCAARVSWTVEPEETFDVELQPGADYTYLDLIRLVHEAHYPRLTKSAHLTEGRIDGPLLANPLHLLVYRSAAQAPPEEGGRPSPADRAPWYLADFWYF